ncbi:translation initiation factor Sui1 [Inhella proteolytica]|uniref:Translation initiation factor Sui1 n=1 Tax=Inhella proteolytica TaxID=2795029 RepID=A0A931J7Z6_9BURK|nr:translation initiation factor Sui1 [Inhella proteolytica]MBH9578457.1 translation initiation factor Sui1 [Inhella proteolytica]
MSASRPVYSTELGRLCPGCGKPVAVCACKKGGAPLGDGQVRVRRETGGRGGKTVTTVRGLPLAEAALQQLAKQLKAACGTGGTCKGGVVEVHGDHVERVLAWLTQQGYKPKKAGG